MGHGDERLKVEMLRFVDVFPTLRSRPEIARHLREYFAREGVAAPAALLVGRQPQRRALALWLRWRAPSSAGR